MIRLYYIRFCDKIGNEFARMDYEGLTFKTEEFVNAYISFEKERFEKIMKVRLYEDPFYREIPNEINIKQLIDEVCKELGLTREFVMSRVKRTEAVDARMAIVQICLDLGVTHGKLRGLFPNGITYHYENSMKRLRKNQLFDKRYRNLKDKVLT